MLGEIRRRSEIRRAMQSVNESLDYTARAQLEIRDPRQDCRIQELRARTVGRVHMWQFR